MRRNEKYRKYESKEKAGRIHKKNGELLLTPRVRCNFAFQGKEDYESVALPTELGWRDDDLLLGADVAAGVT